jgi:hypothetical protein
VRWRLSERYGRPSSAASTLPPVSRPGDIWVPGNHRLICGDACEPRAYEALMAGEKADLVLTDPPIEALRNLQITTPTGASVPLRELARCRLVDRVPRGRPRAPDRGVPAVRHSTRLAVLPARPRLLACFRLPALGRADAADVAPRRPHRGPRRDPPGMVFCAQRDPGPTQRLSYRPQPHRRQQGHPRDPSGRCSS